MSICKHCYRIGYHETYCTRPLYPVTAKPATIHETLQAVRVSCA